MSSRRPSLLLLVISLFASLVATAVPAVAADPNQVFFPLQVTDALNYSDTWGAPRSGGRTHTGTDIMAAQMDEVYAASDATIYAYEGDCAVGAYCSSYYLLLSGDDGRSYFYVHINNDSPGRPNGCDGTGGADNAFSPRLVEYLRANGTLKGMRVQRGEHIAYNGSSGNAGCKVDHVHFEIWNGHGWGSTKTNPYPIVRAAQDAGNVWGPAGAQTAPTRPAPIDYGRLAGSNRVLTSVELSEASFPTGSDTIVIAPAEVYPEALLAAPLAASLDAPVLLTWNHQAAGRDMLDAAVAAEIKRLGATYAVIVGDTTRFDDVLEAQLVDKAGMPKANIRRIGGADRYELSANVAEQVLAYHGIAGPANEPRLPVSDTRTATTTNDPQEIVSPILALGEHADESRGWPDALASSSLGAREVVPVLLTRGGDLPPATARILSWEGIGEVRIAGGAAAVSEDVEREVNALDRETRRLAGSNRFVTSLVIAEELLAHEGVDLEQLYVATGGDYPDALAAGQAVAVLGHPLVLVDGKSPEGASTVHEWLRDRAGSIGVILGVGGPGVVTNEVLEELAIYANWPR